MLLSSYLLLQLGSYEKIKLILSMFTSSTGRKFLEEARDDLSIIHYYAKHYGYLNGTKVNRKIFNIVPDESYIIQLESSYLHYKSTGKIEWINTVSIDNMYSTFNMKTVYNYLNLTDEQKKIANFEDARTGKILPGSKSLFIEYVEDANTKSYVDLPDFIDFLDFIQSDESKDFIDKFKTNSLDTNDKFYDYLLYEGFDNFINLFIKSKTSSIDKDKFDDIVNAMKNYIFTKFIKEKINSDASRKFKTLYALGYDADSVRLCKPIVVNGNKQVNISDNTLKLLNSLLKYVSYNGYYKDGKAVEDILQDIINDINHILSIPANSVMVFGKNYNNLNGKRVSNSTDIDTTSIVYYYYMSNELDSLFNNSSDVAQNIARIFNSTKTVLTNVDSNVSTLEISNSFEDFLKSNKEFLISSCNIPEDDIDNYTISTNHVIKFIKDLYSKFSDKSNIKTIKNSLKSIIQFYALFSSQNKNDYSMFKSLFNFNDIDNNTFVEMCNELYEFFSIPLLSISPSMELHAEINKNIAISREDETIEKPIPELLQMSIITARSAYSYYINYALTDKIIKGGE